MLLIQFLLVGMTMSRTGFEPAPPAYRANSPFYSDRDFVNPVRHVTKKAKLKPTSGDRLTYILPLHP